MKTWKLLMASGVRQEASVGLLRVRVAALRPKSLSEYILAS